MADETTDQPLEPSETDPSDMPIAVTSAPPGPADESTTGAVAAVEGGGNDGDAAAAPDGDAAAAPDAAGVDGDTAEPSAAPTGTSVSSWFSLASAENEEEQQADIEEEDKPAEGGAAEQQQEEEEDEDEEDAKGNPSVNSLPAHVSRKSEAEKLQHMNEVKRLQEEYEKEEEVEAAEEAGHAFFLKEEKLEEAGEGAYFPEHPAEQSAEPLSRASSKSSGSKGAATSGTPWKPDVYLPPKVREACEKLRENRTGQVLNLGNGGSSRRPVRSKVEKPDDADLTSTADLLTKSRRSLNESKEAKEGNTVVPINDEWVGAIAEALAENHSVKSLWLQNNEITDAGAHKLIDGIKAHHVTCVRIHGRDRGPEAWLQHIYFSKNPMTDEAREAIMAAMLWMPPPPKPDMMEEEALSSIKSSIKSVSEDEVKQEDENEKCCCGNLEPMFGISCC